MTLGTETGSSFCTKKGQSQAKGVIGKERKGTLEFCKIKQLPSEPLVTFVERLTQAIELQVKNEGPQEQVLEEMALADANEQCKAAILSLSTEPAPTLHDMLQVCARKIPFIKAHQSHRSRVKPPLKAAANTVLRVAIPRPPPERRTMCLLCDQAGHWASQCPLKKPFLDFRDNGGRRSQRSEGIFSKKLENVNVKLNNPALTSSAFQQKSVDMTVKDPATRETKSPHDQVTWGRGYAYVSASPDLKKSGLKEYKGNGHHNPTGDMLEALAKTGVRS
ncbi:hypothetical protein DUI87_10777 [Hirundo rustica rustica]|uniref:CCHC-type domain-containing protein n=1 Tax=Hirundo rustica rustica TaxID=333673 RepID=A0A3M0KJI9_HIRRU|nr:hypothetical protein DUI87_10777 [Hirundo rustica rustica]